MISPSRLKCRNPASLAVLGLSLSLYSGCAADPGGESPPASGPPPEAPAAPAWSPLTAELVFTSNRGGNSEIYLLGGIGGEWKNLTDHPAKDNWPVWSPDGRRILFQRWIDDKIDVWVMNADGTEQTRLTDHPDHDYQPAWSPGGELISFSSWRREEGDTERANHLYLMNADGSRQRRFLAESPNTSSGLVWSPDGLTLALSRKVGEKGADIFLLDRSGTETGRLTEDDAYDGVGAFSPDGTRLAFYSSREAGSEIAVMTLDGSIRTSVVPPGEYYYPRWSPDGRWLVYTTAAPEGDGEDWDLYAIRSDGSGEPLPLVVGPGREVEGSWRPVNRNPAS